jgi:bifunctional enzyme CysN/CysC
MNSPQIESDSKKLHALFTLQGKNNMIEGFRSFKTVSAIPLSALQGLNVTRSPRSSISEKSLQNIKSNPLAWYQGSSLLEYLETLPLDYSYSDADKDPAPIPLSQSISKNPSIHLPTSPSKQLLSHSSFLLPIQWVNRHHSDFRGFAGTIESGIMQVGDTVEKIKHSILPPSSSAATPKLKNTSDCSAPSAMLKPPIKIQSIFIGDQSCQKAQAGDPVMITLDQEIDISRGDILTSVPSVFSQWNTLEVALIWMDEDPGFLGRTYDLKLATQWASCTITDIHELIDLSGKKTHHPPTPDPQRPFSKNPTENNSDYSIVKEKIQDKRKLFLNDICKCTIKIQLPIVCAPFRSSLLLGSCILIDRLTKKTLGACIIHKCLDNHLYSHAPALSKKNQKSLKGHLGLVLWITGLSGSGKSTLGNALEKHLHKQKYHTVLLDGDSLRKGLNKDLGFQDGDRIENIRRTAEVAKLMADAGLITIVALISPFIQERNQAKHIIGPHRFLEIYLDTPLSICQARDTKGLYKKTYTGEIKNFSGINSAYEPPTDPSIRLDTSSETVSDSLRKILEEFENWIHNLNTFS